MTARYTRFQEIDWQQWQPQQEATLLFVLCDERVLLMRKKRGLGAGKITGPGGRLDPGESLEACAKRELTEEVGLTAGPVRFAGNLSFQFTDGLALKVSIFDTESYSGTLTETDEALPLWFPLSQIPFNEMWADDVLWFPYMLRKELFEARFLFDGDRLVDGEVLPQPPSEQISPN